MTNIEILQTIKIFMLIPIVLVEWFIFLFAVVLTVVLWAEKVAKQSETEVLNNAE